MDEEQPKTLKVPVAGRIYYGIGRNASYDAARRGDIPTIRVGRLLRVPVAAMERRLTAAGDQPDTPKTDFGAGPRPANVPAYDGARAGTHGQADDAAYQQRDPSPASPSLRHRHLSARGHD